MSIADELVDIQAEVVTVLLQQQTCIISRPNKAMDGKGHRAPAFTVLNGGAIACGFYQPKSQNAKPVGGVLASENAWTLQVPVQVLVNGVLVATDVKMGDKVVYNSQTYHVQSVNLEQSLPFVLEVSILEEEGNPEDVP